VILLRVWAKDLEICKLPSLEGWRAEWEPIDRRIVPVSQKIPMPRMRINCEAGAIQDQISTIKAILTSIAYDEDISNKTKEELNNFLMQISLQLKRINQGSMQRVTEMTASRITAGRVMGKLQGVRSTTVIPKSGELKAGTVHLTEGGDIEITISPAFKVG
jgi:hypothetical protein